MSSAMHTTHSPLETRAKRTHARRSCALCKTRKTRCELPDLDVLSSPNALPVEKSCHRCKVLALPCVVDDSSRKQRKRSREEAWASPRDPPLGSPRPKQPKALRSAHSVDSERIGSSHSRDVLRDFVPDFHTAYPSASNGYSATDDDLASPERGMSRGARPCQIRGMRYHGRPLELVCAMLRVAYERRQVRSGRQGVATEEVDLDKLVDHDMRARLEPGQVFSF